MAIYRRKRTLQNLISDIDVDVIPLEFVKNVKCVLQDGTTVVLDQPELEKESPTDVETMIQGLTFFDSIADLHIQIDFDRVEEDVEQKVSKLFKGTNDKSDNSL